jgi:hypothetical protein
MENHMSYDDPYLMFRIAVAAVLTILAFIGSGSVPALFAYLVARGTHVKPRRAVMIATVLGTAIGAAGTLVFWSETLSYLDGVA